MSTSTASLSSTISFQAKLEARVASIDSLLCVGLDPHLQELPIDSTSANASTEEERCDAAYTFCKTLIDATAPHAACYKPNAAFFEALGVNHGMATLARVLQQIPNDIPILLDVKRGDIGSTAAAYADACFLHLQADAVTLSPLMGWDSVAPFVTGIYANKGAFLLCKTSNPGSNDLLALTMNGEQQNNNFTATTLYETIARLTNKWSASNDNNYNLGLVVGATDAVALAKARQAAGPDVWILAPGVGAQGGSLNDAVAAGMNPQGSRLLIPVSRGISRALNQGEAAKELKEKIRGAVAEQKQVMLAADDNNKTNTVSGDDNVAISIQPYQTKFLEFSLAQGVLKFGAFTLKSGRTSPYFFNAGLFCSGGALFKLGKAYASAIMASSDL